MKHGTFRAALIAKSQSRRTMSDEDVAEARRLAGEGLKPTEIGRRLGFAASTVRTYVVPKDRKRTGVVR